MSDFLKLEFVTKVRPLAELIQEWTLGKCAFRGRVHSPTGIHSSLITADIILMSNWGTHPIAAPEVDGKYSNNLALLKATRGYPGKVQVYDKVSYRAYKNWHDFAVGYSDYLVFSDQFTDVLLATDLEEQIAYFSLKKLEPETYNRRISELIELLEIDVNGKAKPAGKICTF